MNQFKRLVGRLPGIGQSHHAWSHLCLVPTNFQNHFMNGLEHNSWVNRVTTVLCNNLSSPCRELRELRLQLMNPDVVKTRQLFVNLRITYSERLASRQNNEWTVPEVTRSMCLGGTFLPSIASSRSHKRLRL